MVKVFFHSTFRKQLYALEQGAETNQEMANWYDEIMSLVGALNEYGRTIENTDASHPIVTSRKYEAHCLRRHPANIYAQSAVNSPTLRIPYVWFTDTKTKEELAVIFKIGDKTNLGNGWYPEIVEELTSRLVPEWEKRHPTHKPKLAKR